MLVVASECAPEVNSGDLGTTVAALVDGLASSGHHVTLVVPRFIGVLEGSTDVELRTLAMGDRTETVALVRGQRPSGVSVVAVDHQGFFGRPNLYGAEGFDYPDNPRRFAVLTMAACDFAASATHPFDVVHAFDWQAGLLPVLISARRSASAALAHPAVVFTAHAPAFQGRCSEDWLVAFGLDASYASVDALEYWGGLSLLKGGVNFADVVTVGSVAEALTSVGGAGFEGIFAARGRALAPLDFSGRAADVSARAADVYARAIAAASTRAGA